MDVKVMYTWKRFGILIEATNLLDRETFDIGNVIQPGRWIIAGIEIR